jgi:signal transduction histidine kinase
MDEHPSDPGGEVPPTDSAAAMTSQTAGDVLGRMTDAFFAVDENWHLTYVNDQARPILAAASDGVPAQGDLLGRNLWEAIPTAVGTTFEEQYHRAMDSQEAVNFEEYFEPLDTWFEVRAYPSETGITVYFKDVTARREQRVRLEERERVLRRVHDVTADTERSFEEKVERLLDIGCEVLETDFGSLSHVSGDRYYFDHVRAPDGEVTAGDSIPVSATSCERSISERTTLVLADMARDAPDLACRPGNEQLGLSAYLGAPVVVDGDVDGTFCFYDREPRDEFTDWEVALVNLMSQWIGSERTRIETVERLARQNSQLEEFASIVSHDLRNPLNVLKSGLTLARETGEAEHFDRSQRAADRMDALIQDLLDLARAGEEIGETSVIDLEDHVVTCWSVVSTSKATLQTETDARIRADAARLQQLFENLFRNAVEHGGPDVTVTVGDLPDGFYVADDGPGIPEDEREAVLESGYSTDDDGTGYGLKIAETIALAHGWSLEVGESDDGGARFEIRGLSG